MNERPKRPGKTAENDEYSCQYWRHFKIAVVSLPVLSMLPRFVSTLLPVTLQPPDSMHLEAAQGWLELGNHEEAFEELERIDAPLRSHPDVLEVRWGIYAKVTDWEACLHIGKAMVKLDPRRFTGWINRSFALHELKRTQEACDQLHEGLYRFRDESLIWYNLACYACVLG